MDYEAEKYAILSETDMGRLFDRDAGYTDRALSAAQGGDTDVLNIFIRLGHWVMFRTADFSILDLPVVNEHTYAVVGNLTIDAFARAIEVDPPPQTFNEALQLAVAGRGN